MNHRWKLFEATHLPPLPLTYKEGHAAIRFNQDTLLAPPPLPPASKLVELCSKFGPADHFLGSIMTIGTSAPPDFFKFLALPVSSLKNHRIYSFCGLLAESRKHHLSSRVLTAGVAEHLLPLDTIENHRVCTSIFN
nr:uncharacterized protein LOC127306076 [Lolium perenne]